MVEYAGKVTPEPLVQPEDDIGLLCLIVSNGFTAGVLDQLSQAGFGDSRFSHGFIVQGLLAGDTTVTQLAERLGVTVQAASKTVREMERLGYIDRHPDPADGRSSRLALSARGKANLAAARKARLTLTDSLRKSLGDERTRELTALLRLAAAEFGGLESMATRRVRPVDG